MFFNCVTLNGNQQKQIYISAHFFFSNLYGSGGVYTYPPPKEKSQQKPRLDQQQQQQQQHQQQQQQQQTQQHSESAELDEPSSGSDAAGSSTTWRLPLLGGIEVRGAPSLLEISVEGETAERVVLRRQWAAVGGHGGEVVEVFVE